MTTNETATEKPALWITRFEVENFKRVRVARITPDGAMIKIAGRNKQGKTSILDALEALLRGPKATPPDPVHKGKLSAKTKAFIGNTENPKQYVVERKYKNGAETLSITGPDGKSIDTKKQTTLDEIFESMAFEVSRFLRLKPDEQDALLKDAAGIDFTALDAEYKGTFDARGEKTKELKRVQAQIASTQRIDKAPKAEEASADIILELKTATDRGQERYSLQSQIQALITSNASDVRSIEELDAKIQEYKKLIDDRRAKCTSLQASLDAAPVIDPDPIRTRLQALEENNRQVRHNAKLDELEGAEALAESEIERLADRLEHIKGQKSQQLADAKFPVPGLGFDETGPTLNGFPLEQASKREQLELCVALAIELKPTLRVFIVRDASVIDEDGLQALAELAARHECQLWVEIATKNHAADMVFIEDGEVVDPPVAVTA